MKRYLETFFRQPWRHLLPLLLIVPLSAVAAFAAASRATPYAAGAIVAVNLDPGRERPLGETPPAQQYAELLGELMEVDSFVQGALAQTQLASTTGVRSAEADPATGALQPAPATPDEGADEAQIEAARSGWQQGVGGANTLKVLFRCHEPTFCREFVSAVLTSFRQQVAAARLAPKAAASEYYQRQLRSAEERLGILDPATPGRDTAWQAYETLLARSYEAGVEETLETQAVEQSFRIISPPEARATPFRPLAQAAQPLGLGLLLGIGLSLASVALATWRDDRVRTSDDIARHLGLVATAIVPERGWSAQYRTSEGPTASAPTHKNGTTSRDGPAYRRWLRLSQGKGGSGHGSIGSS